MDSSRRNLLGASILGGTTLLGGIGLSQAATGRPKSSLVSTAEGTQQLDTWMSRTAEEKMLDLPVHLFDFVPASEHAHILDGTSTYDCAEALSSAIAAAQSNSLAANAVILPKGLINTSRGFVISHPVRFIGQGGFGPGYSVFPTELGTKIRYTGSDASSIVFEFRNVNYGGAGMYHMAIDGGGAAFRGLQLDAVLGFGSDDLHITGCSDALLALISTSQTTSWNQFKNLFLSGETNGVCCLRLSGGDAANGGGSNACHCTFENLHINHGGTRHGILLAGVDNITFLMTYIYRAPGGDGKGVLVQHDEQGGQWFPIANTFMHLQAGAGGWYEPAGGNPTYPTAVIYGYQTDNGAPLPVTNARRLPYWTNNGDLVGVGGIGRSSYGGDWGFSVYAAAGSTSTAVAFPSGPRSSAAYNVIVNSPTTIAHAIQSKTQAGFSIVWASPLASTISVDIIVVGG